MKELSTIQAGIAGEYFVAAELTRRGFVASLTLRKTRGIDILASNSDATRSVGIQVKTSRSGGSAWLLNKKAEIDVAENLFYVFVRLPEGESPSYYIVPRKVVAKHVRQGHQAWLGGSGRDCGTRKDTGLRKFEDPTGQFKDAWQTLGLDAD